MSPSPNLISRTAPILDFRYPQWVAPAFCWGRKGGGRGGRGFCIGQECPLDFRWNVKEDVGNMLGQMLGGTVGGGWAPLNGFL